MTCRAGRYGHSLESSTVTPCRLSELFAASEDLNNLENIYYIPHADDMTFKLHALRCHGVSNINRYEYDPHPY